MTTYDPAELDPDSTYTPGCHARWHLETLARDFTDDTAAPDPETCHATEFPEPFAVLVRGWNRCVDAARIINNRYRQDWEHGGAVTVIAPRVREASLRELADVWHTLARKYIAETLDANRQPFDCTFCGTNMPPSVVGDEARCGHCCCVLWMNSSETDWTSEWEEV